MSAQMADGMPTHRAPIPDDAGMSKDDTAASAPLELDLAELGERERYFLLTSVIVPRPIAWVSTLGADGVRNLAPYSYFNACSATPPIVHFTSTTSRDSLANVRATGEFVVNVVSEDLAPAMRVSSAALYSGEDEFEIAGLQTVPSRTVAPPRVAGAKVALECRLRQLLEIGEGTMVFGDVLHVHVERTVWRDGRVDPTLLRPVGRLSAPYFATVSEVYSLDLPEDVKRATGDYTIRGGPSGPGGP
jgi:flavin reductase (DIM6/NTAB) family NADH-FMN oxidoreductase RutF